MIDYTKFADLGIKLISKFGGVATLLRGNGSVGNAYDPTNLPDSEIEINIVDIEFNAMDNTDSLIQDATKKILIDNQVAIEQDDRIRISGSPMRVEN